MGLFRWTYTTVGSEGTLNQRIHCYKAKFWVRVSKLQTSSEGHTSDDPLCLYNFMVSPATIEISNKFTRTLDSLGCWPLIAAHSKPTYFVLRVYHTLRSLDRPVARQSCLAGHVLFIVNDDSSLWPLPYVVVFVVCSFFFPSFFCELFFVVSP